MNYTKVYFCLITPLTTLIIYSVIINLNLFIIITLKNCAERFSGAWWYTACLNSNLNGLYLRGAHESFGDGINWYHWRGYKYSMKSTVMKIKPIASLPRPQRPTTKSPPAN